jgi:hypothetical protein
MVRLRKPTGITQDSGLENEKHQDPESFLRNHAIYKYDNAKVKPALGNNHISMISLINKLQWSVERIKRRLSLPEHV